MGDHIVLMMGGRWRESEVGERKRGGHGRSDCTWDHRCYTNHHFLLFRFPCDLLSGLSFSDSISELVECVVLYIS